MGYAEEQDELSRRVHAGEVRVVDCDPEGMFPEDWLAVVIRHPTGVVYVNQSAGVACQQRMEEGYLVMLGAPRLYDEHPRPLAAELLAVFHEDDHCMWPWIGDAVPEERIRQLAGLVKKISYWSDHPQEPFGIYSQFELDLTRRDAIAEAWIPVRTADGPGVLLYQNCD